MFTQQRRIMEAGGLTFWLLIPPILVGIAVSALYVLIAMLNAMLFTELLSSRNIHKIVTLIAIIAVLLFVRPLLDVCGQLLQNRAGLVIKSNLRRTLLKEIDRKGPMRIGLGRSGNVQSVITDGVEAIEPYFVKYFTQLTVTAVTALALTIGLATISIPIAFVLLACGIAVVATPRLWDAALATRGRSHWEAYETLNADFIDAMMGMSTLKSFGAAQAYGDKLHKQSQDLLTSTLSQLRLSLGETGISTTMKVLGPALALIIAIAQVRAGNVDVGHLFFITLLSVEMFRPFTLLSTYWHEAFFGISALASMNHILTDIACERRNVAREQGAVVCERGNVAREQGAVVCEHTGVNGAGMSSADTGNTDMRSGIVFDDVSYTYIGSEKPALEHLNFRIEKGKTTALVGLSGAGKSTALGLLIGYDQPTAGTISVFGHSPAQTDITQTVTLVPQEPIIFPGTVRDILAAANPQANDTDMLNALKIAHANTLHTEFEAQEPAQTQNSPADSAMSKSVLDLPILEHAKNLSGGQKQRLAIARALIRNTSVLVLDESTSALDTYTEHRLLADLRQARPDLTLLVVTHRTDTAAKADGVVVLSQGGKSCYGPPEELANNPQSTWSQLLKAQIGEN